MGYTMSVLLGAVIVAILAALALWFLRRAYVRATGGSAAVEAAPPPAAQRQVQQGSETMHAPEPGAPVEVSLADVVSEMAETAEHRTGFLHRGTGEVITLSEDQLRALDDPYAEEAGAARVDDALRSAFEAGDLLELPDSFETQEYSLRERFCRELTNVEHREQLLEALRRKQAFRSFTQALGRLGIREQWEHHRDRAFETIAVAWLDKHGIRYRHDRAQAA